MFELFAATREFDRAATARKSEQRSQAEALKRLDRMERKVRAIRGRLSIGPARPNAA